MDEDRKKRLLELEKLRKEINEIDAGILRFINRRLSLARRIGEIKKSLELPVYSPEREQEILRRLQSENEGPLDTELVKKIFTEIISASRSIQRRLRVAYLGPEMTFTHQAVLEHFGSAVDMTPLRSLDDVFREVERGAFDYGVVPVENSTEGVVTHTLDLFIESDLKVRAEISLRISYDLLSLAKHPDDIKRIYSHPQALAQCRNYLEGRFSDIPRLETDSTAAAASIASRDSRGAAIASRQAGIQYGLNIIDEHIEDNRDNITRFLVIGREETERSDRNRTSIIFSVVDKPGTLYNALKAFAENGVNLKRIESRPNKKEPWQYIFFVDLDGHIEDENVRAAMKELEHNCTFVKNLGSYPVSA